MSVDLKAPFCSVHDQILALAKQHGVPAGMSALDHMAEAMTCLASDHVEHTTATRALIKLQQKGVVTPEEGVQWLRRLLAEEAV